LRFPASLRRFVASSLILLLAGCGAAGGGQAPAPKTQAQLEGGSAKLNAWLANQPLDVPAAVYHVEPPDELKIVAPQVKEIDGTEVTVRADGKISLNLVQEIDVNNKTPAEISEQIAQKLGAYYAANSIDVSVVVKKYKSKVFYVMGQVLEPGVKPYTGRDTIVKVLADAKLNDEAWPQKVVIVRPNEDVSVKQRVTVDLKEMYVNGNVNQNFLIEAGDLIYVPPSPVAEVGMTLKKVLFPIMPAANMAQMFMGGI
jgi:polysaccharide export outer membrane protein